MAGTDDYLRALLGQAKAEEAFLDGLRRPANDLPPAPAVSLMITNRQRAELRALGFSDEAIRRMTPAEAHAQLGLTRPEE
jgi:hypothetical protein